MVFKWCLLKRKGADIVFPLSGVSARSFQQCFSLCSPVFNLQTATPGVRVAPVPTHPVYSNISSGKILTCASFSQGKTIDFVGVDESTARWVQDFSVKPYATPAKLESIDGQTHLFFYYNYVMGYLHDVNSH